MSEMILSIAAEADVTPSEQVGKITGKRQRAENGPMADSLPAHQFLAYKDRGKDSRSEQNPQAELDETTVSQPIDDFFAEKDRRQRIYRNRTVAMLAAICATPLKPDDCRRWWEENSFGAMSQSIK